MKDLSKSQLEERLFDEAQLLLSEKRTALSVLRTGISVFILPLSVLSVLIATSKSYTFSAVLHFMVPLLILLIGLVSLACYLIGRSIARIHHYDALMAELKKKAGNIGKFIDS